MAANRAPIAFFAFNRPEHTARTLAALAANPEAAETSLHVFVDGARNDAERPVVGKVLQISQTATGFRSVTVHAATDNRGLYRAITTGVSSVLADAKRVIVVEDDILVSPFFLAYMNDALERYENEPSVGSIHGYSPPVKGLPNYFFLRGGDCWGWATWADRWALFDSNADKLRRLLVSKHLLSEFCRSRGTNSLLYLLRRARGRNQSWAVLWDVSLFLAERYTLHPGVSMVSNIGNDGSGVHSVASTVHATPVATEYTGLPDLTIDQDSTAASALGLFLDGEHGKRSHFQRALRRSYAKLAARFPFLTPP